MLLLKKTPFGALSDHRSLTAWFVLVTMFLDICTARRNGGFSHQSSEHQELVGTDDVDFLAIDFLLDGERERRLRYRGVSAKETSTGSERGVSLRQITDGKHFIQMIHSRGQGLMDCDYSRRRKTIDAFLESFKRDARRTYSVSHTYNHTNHDHHNYNYTRTNQQHKDMSEEDDSPDDELGKERKQERARIESYIENGVLTPEDLDFNWNQRRVGVHNATFILVKMHKQVPQDMRSWLDFAKMRRQCQRKHRQLKRDFKRRKRQAEKLQMIKEREEVHPRFRRGIIDYFIAPGTKWCGIGSSAKSYNELGGFSAADRCCRWHDACTNNIGAVENKYDYFNFSPFTMSHCSCDRRFRTCLKIAGTTTAELVGKLFFNVVQTKCFVFKTEKVCTKYAWWKKTCKKYTKKKRAVLRSNIAY
uniref:Phospholipase A2 n=1 Tax=Xenopsylla cheopis TaxID=163159 RepID=A0A6M2DV29_XENCH